MTNPIVLERLDELSHTAYFLIINQMLDRQERVDGGCKGDSFNGSKPQLRSALGDVQGFFGATSHQTREIRGWGKRGNHPFGLLEEFNDFPDNKSGLGGLSLPELFEGFKLGCISSVGTKADGWVSLAGHFIGKGN